MRKAFSRQRRRGMVQLHGRSTFALPLGWLHGIVVSYAKSIQLQQRLRRLTLRSSGPATAGHQARVGGTRYIFTAPSLAPCRSRPLTSNVRPHNLIMQQPSDYIATASALVAVCALGISIWQGHVTREHAKLSVRPHIEIHFEILQQGALTITAVNTGIGPGFIHQLTVSVGTETFSLREANELRRLARHLAGDTPEYIVQFYVADASTAVSAGSRIALLEIAATDGLTAPWMASAESALRHVELLSAECRFRCMYGTEQTSRARRSAA